MVVTVNTEPVERLAGEWEDEAETLRRRGATRQAAALESAAEDLRERVRECEAEATREAHYGVVTFCVVGMIDDLKNRGLSRRNAWAVIAEIDRRRSLYRENSNVIPPYRGEGG